MEGFIVRRGVSGASKPKEKLVPDPYIQVDYIKFNGTANSAYTTNIQENSNIYVDVTFDYDNSPFRPVFATTDSMAGYYAFLSCQNSTTYQTGNGTGTVLSFTGNYNGKHHFLWNFNGKYIFDEVEKGSCSSGYNESPYTLGYAWGTYYYSGKIYRFSLKTTNPELQDFLDFVPAKYVNNGTTQYGFYNTVSKTFVSQSGWTGGFDNPS